MPEALTHLQQSLSHWANDAQQAGWLSPNAARTLDSTVVATPGSLFSKPNRPLVVGFFGGTGVGKSTLLNRFAGQSIAKATAERPTSRNITLYIHESVAIAHLPKEFPIQRIEKNTHQNNQYRSVMWIDMPDFDSVEQSNRELVNQCLPHIDVVIYVVSPERYKDDRGWRLLLEHGEQHAWLFAINHWDKGDERQKEDFLSMLVEAGFSDPHLFCTDSSGTANGGDDFATFQETVNTLADQQLVDQLESRGVVQRLKQIRTVTDQLREKIGSAEAAAQYKSSWPAHWQAAESELIDSNEWKIASIAETYAATETGLMASVVQRLRGKPAMQNHTQLAESQSLGNITDEVYFARITESVDDFTQRSIVNGIPMPAVKKILHDTKERFVQRIPAIVEQSVQRSMASPGSKGQRLLYKMLKSLSWLLPLLALGWVAFRVVNVFRLGAENPAVYLSSNFAVHSLLLAGLAWFIPAFLGFRLKPSRANAAARGARDGLVQANTYISEEVSAGLDKVARDQAQHLSQLDEILSSGLQFDDSELPESLQRMLINAP